MVKLQVLISTYGTEGLRRLSKMHLPAVEGVEYRVHCQTGIPDGEDESERHGRISPPQSLVREDMTIVYSRTKGLSRNRNLLLHNATAPYCLIADDDISYTPEALKEVIAIFESNPDIDIAAFKSANTLYRPGDEGGCGDISAPVEEKTYSDHPFDLRHPVKGYYLTSFEIAFRRESVVASGIRFNENFGVGAPRYGSGEEELWVHALLQSGMKGSFYPVMLALHHGATTGVRAAAEPRVLRAQGILIPVVYPLTGFPRILLKGWRVSRQSGKSLLHCLRYLLSGYKDLLLHKKRIFQQ